MATKSELRTVVVPELSSENPPALPVAMLDTNWQAYDVITTVAAITNTQPSTNRWTSVQTSLTLAGGAWPVLSGSVKGTNPIYADQQTRATNPGKPIMFDQGRRVYECDMNVLFEGFTEWDYISAGTEVALVVTVDDGTHSWVATMNVRTVGDTVGVDGPGEVTVPLRCVATSSTSDAAVFTCVTTNADAAA